MNHTLYDEYAEYLLSQGVWRNANIVVEGDSLSTVESGYGAYLAPEVFAGCNCVYNVATGGDAMWHDENPVHIGILTTGAIQVDRLYDPRFEHNIAILLSRNDLGADAATLISAYNQWGSERQNVGWETMILTLPVSNDESWEVLRLDRNAAIMADHSGFDFLCDIGSDEIFGDLDSVSDITWYIDSIHHTVAGRQRLADLVVADLKSVVGGAA